MILFPNAKINLGLDVLKKRQDGYHEINSCFVPIDWYDILEVLSSEKYKFTSTGINIPEKNEENLCTLAFKMLKEDFNIQNVNVHLHKNIPIGAGLGGGSADAAFMLKALNNIFDLKLSTSRLQFYASRLGSDCPFFINNKPVIASGTGMVLSPIVFKLLKVFILLIYPNLHISTKEAYSNIKPSIPKKTVHEIIYYSSKNWKYWFKNDFEVGLFPKYPILNELKNKFYEAGAFYSSMTGSGSTVYGLFQEKPNISFNENYTFHQGELLLI